MATGTIMNVWSDDTHGHMAVRVSEGGSAGDVEYIGSVPLATLNALGTAAQKRAALVAAVKATRDAQLVGASAPIAGISGSVTI